VTNDKLEGDNLINSENFDQKHNIIVQDGGYTAKWSKKYQDQGNLETTMAEKRTRDAIEGL
jgi:hypothetical protein